MLANLKNGIGAAQDDSATFWKYTGNRRAILAFHRQFEMYKGKCCNSKPTVTVGNSNDTQAILAIHGHTSSVCHENCGNRHVMGGKLWQYTGNTWQGL